MSPVHLGPRPKRIGFLAFVEHSGVAGTRSQGLRDGLELFQLAESLGYDAGWVRHRHLEPYLSAPLPFLTAVGQHTSRIALGTSVVPLRYEQPVRLAEEAATTDLLVDGRLHLGLSAGYAEGEALFGPVFDRIADPERSYDEEVETRLNRFLEAVRGGVLAIPETDHLVAPAGTPLTIQPLSPTLPERLSYGAGRPATAVRTGKLGLGLQLSTLNTVLDEPSFEETQLGMIQAYRRAHEAATGNDGWASVGRLILPILRGSDLDDYDWLLRRDAQRQRDLRSPGAPPILFGVVHHGTPEEIIESLRADVALREADELTVVLPFGHPPAVNRRILETVAESVLPGLALETA